ncbi:MAG: hypothetical protein Q9159_004900 [Coniocarpon cinnabarinum]
MAHRNESSETRPGASQPGQSHDPPPQQLSSQPQVPSITLPPSSDGRAATFTSTNYNDLPASEPSQTPVSPRPRSRRGSFSLIRRSKSREYSAQPEKETVRKDSGGHRKLSRRRKDREVSKEEATNKLGMPPQLPSYHSLPQMNTPFNAASGPNSSHLPPSASENRYNIFPNTAERPASKTGYDPNAFYRRHLGMSEKPSPAPPSKDATQAAAGSSPPTSYVDPYARTESMTNRGRSSYANASVNGHVNSPRRVRRRKDPTPFNILVVGSKGSGKTSFVDFLRHALTQPSRFARLHSKDAIMPTKPVTKQEQGSLFTSTYLETEVEGERIGVTVYDSNGLEKHLIDLQLREFSFFLESKFQETFREEQKVMRSAGVQDPHIHCVFLVLDPARLDSNISATVSQNQKTGDGVNRPRVVGGLDQDLDVDVLKALQGKSNVVPVISKSDTVTTAHMAYLKRIVWDSFKKLKIDPLEVLNMESDDEVDGYGPGSSPSKPIAEESEHPKPAERPRPSLTETSVYDSASEGELGDDAEDSDSTISKKKNKAKSANTLSLISPNGSTGLSLRPKPDDIRVSTMSENVDLPMLPLSIISPDIHDPTVVGRRFPWGFADPYNPEHCDFTRLLDSVFSEWREDFREASRERWYEGWRTNRLRTRGTMYSPQPGSRTVSGNQGRTVSGANAYGGKVSLIEALKTTEKPGPR